MITSYIKFVEVFEQFLREEGKEKEFISEYTLKNSMKPRLVPMKGFFNKLFNRKENTTTIREVLDHIKANNMIDTESIISQAFVWDYGSDWAKISNKFSNKHLGQLKYDPTTANIEYVMNLFYRFLNVNNLTNEICSEITRYRDKYPVFIIPHERWLVVSKKLIGSVKYGEHTVDHLANVLMFSRFNVKYSFLGKDFWEKANKKWLTYYKEHKSNLIEVQTDNFQPTDDDVTKTFCEFVDKEKFEESIAVKGKWTTIPDPELYASRSLNCNRWFYRKDNALNLISDAFTGIMNAYWKQKDFEWRKIVNKM